MKLPVHEGLYDPETKTPQLQGTRCDACGATFFPPLSIGCEVCGAQSLQPATLVATGVILSVSTVHLHGGSDIQAPFTIAEIALDDGPLIRGTMTRVVEPEAIGARTAARFVVVRVDDDGNEVVEPRFELVAS